MTPLQKNILEEMSEDDTPWVFEKCNQRERISIRSMQRRGWVQISKIGKTRYAHITLDGLKALEAA